LGYAPIGGRRLQKAAEVDAFFSQAGRNWSIHSNARSRTNRNKKTHHKFYTHDHKEKTTRQMRGQKMVCSEYQYHSSSIAPLSTVMVTLPRRPCGAFSTESRRRVKKEY
jgi:hypothetical protein